MRRGIICYVSVAVCFALAGWFALVALQTNHMKRKTFELTSPVSGPPFAVSFLSHNMLKLPEGLYPSTPMGWLFRYLVYYLVLFLPSGVMAMGSAGQDRRWRDQPGLLIAQVALLLTHIVLIIPTIALIRA